MFFFYGIVLEEGSKEGFKEIRPICAYACESTSYNNKPERDGTVTQ